MQGGHRRGLMFPSVCEWQRRSDSATNQAKTRHYADIPSLGLAGIGPSGGSSPDGHMVRVGAMPFWLAVTLMPRPHPHVVGHHASLTPHAIRSRSARTSTR
jgi:hypothetical protein